MKKSPLEYFIRGSEMWRHRTHMFSVAVVWCFSLALVAALLFQYCTALVVFSEHERAVFYYNRIASAQTAVGLGKSRLLERTFVVHGVEPARLAPSQIAFVTDSFYRTELQFRGWLILLAALLAGVAAFRFAVLGHLGFGLKKSTDDFLRGAELVAPEVVAARVTDGGNASRYTFAGVPIPTSAVVQNFLVTGAVGKGKSQLFFALMRQVAAAKKKAIVWDLKGEFCEEFYRPGKDVILNIFDDRSPGWDFFAEIDRDTDFDQIAYSLCPDPENSNDESAKYFAGAARTIFAWSARSFWKEGEHDTQALIRFLLSGTDQELFDRLTGTPAAAYIRPDVPKANQAIRSTLSEAIKYLAYLPASGFSIRQWVSSEDDSWLFLTSDPSVIDMIKPIVSLWLDLAIRASATLPRTSEDRLWLFLDELAALKHVSVLPNSVTEMRAYGVVHVIGMQNVAQAVKMFGKEVSQVIRSCLQNYAVMAVADEETAESYSKLLGAQELYEGSESTSFGAVSSRDGSSVQTGRKEKRIVLPSELMRLPDLEGFVKVAGDFPVARVKFPYMFPKKNQPGFRYREDLRVRKPVANGGALPPSEAEAPAHSGADSYSDLKF